MLAKQPEDDNIEVNSQRLDQQHISSAILARRKVIPASVKSAMHDDASPTSEQSRSFPRLIEAIYICTTCVAKSGDNRNRC